MLPGLLAPRGCRPSQVYPETTGTQQVHRSLTSLTGSGSDEIGLTSGPGSPRSPASPLMPGGPSAPCTRTRSTVILGHQSEELRFQQGGDITHRKSTATFVSRDAWFPLKKETDTHIIRRKNRQTDRKTGSQAHLQLFGSLSIKFDSFLSRNSRWTSITLEMMMTMVMMGYEVIWFVNLDH